MKKIGVIFGGVTCEHDVSIVTGLQLIENMDKSKYEVHPIYIHSNGAWYTGAELLDAALYKDFEKKEPHLKKAMIPADRKGLIVYEKGIFSKEKWIPLDAVIPAMHGMNGEDGSVQGLLELANIPYTSSGILGASVGMDKILMKKVFEAYGLPVLPYTSFLRESWQKQPERILDQIEKELTYPMFVKPSNLGSSIGISKAKDRDSLRHAIEVATYYDSRILVEKGVSKIREINCSALGYKEEVETSVCEEPVNWSEFLTFEDKYLHGVKSTKSGTLGAKTGATGSKMTTSVETTGSKQGGMASMGRRIPANLSKEQTEEIQSLTVRAFKALDSKGVVRIDFIIDEEDNKIYINEINTIPGSFAFYLWQYNGITYSTLIDKLIAIAEKANEDKNKNQYTYESNIIGKITKIEK